MTPMPKTPAGKKWIVDFDSMESEQLTVVARNAKEAERKAVKQLNDPTFYVVNVTEEMCNFLEKTRR